MAARELVRQPGRFAPVVAALVLLAALSVLFGGLLDGLSLGGTAALRGLRADLVVLDDDARGQIGRSQLSGDVRDAVAAVDGVASTGVLASARLPVALPRGRTGLVTLLTADHRPPGVPADLGDDAVIDAALAARGVAPGDELVFDDTRLRTTASAGLVGLGLGGSAWVAPARWQDIVSQVRPDLAPPRRVVTFPEVERVPASWPALTVRLTDGADAAMVAAAIDAVVATETLTVDEVVAAVPGTQRERRVFGGLIAVTVLSSCVVVALFLGLTAVERRPLLSALRALGVRGTGLAAGLVVQAVTVSLAALAIAAGLVAATVPLLPDTVPLLLRPARLGSAAVGLVVAAMVGALCSLRRVVRADPAAVMS